MAATRPLPLALLAFAALALAASPAYAQPAVRAADSEVGRSVDRQGPADDEVGFVLEVEDWVETTTATVRIAADLAVEAGGFGAARLGLVDTLRAMDTGAEWRIVDFGKLRDDAGFERWRVVAEARVPEAALAGLAGKAAEATRPGRSLSVAAIDYTPTLAEREAVVERLRGEVYGRVAKEIAALNAAFGDRRFRVRSIDLTPGFRPEPRLMMTMARAEAAAPKAADAAGGLAGAEKATLSARVILAASVE